ncbi:Glucose-1-phosphate cytidylyltransferase [Nocardioides dokdonensis FR1436]|uniref:Glucose-1-phosphate cytidylyltransferase n=1 Tax=Nocardioides dokdonensis FR1436 TaxID=1300347 RepID=A0A1A9GFT1_9ACTN|nr:sugar phosphate nucleotidyltransferase [Nocardioides dokdonensis]ANH36550.1 Glucose-1-phosphate cytidylyltransferase [Nocardioides dokdonensis FR1436]
MKVVLFCGGLGMRMRADNQSLPKPMMPIGSRPVLWHVMRYYAYFGHTEFVLCLGHGAQAVKDYFLNYQETASNDFVLTKGGSYIEMLSTDISEWTITFVDTGMETAIGERLRRVRPYLEDDGIFLANYGDVLTDAPMDELVAQFEQTDAVAQMLAVKPQDSFHVVDLDADGQVAGLVPVADMSLCINGGYFVLRQGIFDYLEEGDDLVMDGCVRAARDGRVRAVRYDGFWAPMDTLKERSALEHQYRHGISPWALWRERPVLPGGQITPVVTPLAI